MQEIRSPLVKETKYKFPIVKQKGGKLAYHYTGHEHVQEWKGWELEKVESFSKRDYQQAECICSLCRGMLVMAAGADDFKTEHRKYMSLLQKWGDYPTIKLLEKFVMRQNGHLVWQGNKLFFMRRDERWYIEVLGDDIVLYHNNYVRSETKRYWSSGFHQEESADNDFNRMIYLIVRYDYEKAHNQEFDCKDITKG